MTIFSYIPNIYADTLELGFVLGPQCKCVFAEDGNRPGDVRAFDSEEECKAFCNKMNAEEGTCFFKVNFSQEDWDKVEVEIQVLEAEKADKAELEAGAEDDFWFAKEMRLKGIRLR